MPSQSQLDCSKVTVMSPPADSDIIHPCFSYREASGPVNSITTESNESNKKCKLNGQGGTVKIKTKIVKKEWDAHRHLTKGTLRSAFLQQSNAFNVQILSVKFVSERSIYQATISDGTEMTTRCYFSSKSVSRITKNKLVCIKVVDYMVKEDYIHINKYYILSKESATIGQPVSMDGGVISGPDGVCFPVLSSLPNLNLNVTEDHELLIDDFLKFTGESRSSFEDAAAVSYITDHCNDDDRPFYELSTYQPYSFDFVHQPVVNEDLIKVHWDHCYTSAEYFSNLNSLESEISSVFDPKVCDDNSSLNATSAVDDGLTLNNDTAVVQTTPEDSCFINFEVGAECEL